MKVLRHTGPFLLESGRLLPDLEIAYDTYGTLNAAGTNVVWICHALTANSDVRDWWPHLVGPGRVWDTDRYYVVCANILGSCYGTSGPLSTNPETGAPYNVSFPPITIRDMTRAHALLADHLGVASIFVLAGGSMGGYQALEWCALAPRFIRQLFLIATSAQESAWGKAIHEAQRLAIEADPTWQDPSGEGGRAGLQAARAIGMLTYRTYAAYAATQGDDDPDKLDDFRAPSYIRYQGAKLANRFQAYSYWLLTKAMDTHHLGRGRGQSAEEVLKGMAHRTLIMGIRSDQLCPLPEQAWMASCIPGATFVAIESLYGHDGFLTETEAVSLHVGHWLQKNEEHYL